MTVAGEFDCSILAQQRDGKHIRLIQWSMEVVPAGLSIPHTRFRYDKSFVMAVSFAWTARALCCFSL